METIDQNIYHAEQVKREKVEGLLFLPKHKHDCGALIILHERYGLAQHTLDLAKRLSDAGYVAFAPDLFAGRYHSKEALLKGIERVNLTDSECAQVINDSIDMLKSHDQVLPDQIVIMGVCQSGRYPVVVNSRRKDIAANVIYYGAAAAKEWEPGEWNEEPMESMLSQLDAPSLFVFGEKDHIISLDNIRRLRNVLESSEKSYRMKVYAGAPHGFLNDTMPGRYTPDQANAAWEQLLFFLDEVFSGEWTKEKIRWEFESCIAADYDFKKNVRLE